MLRDRTLLSPLRQRIKRREETLFSIPLNRPALFSILPAVSDDNSIKGLSCVCGKKPVGRSQEPPKILKRLRDSEQL